MGTNGSARSVTTLPGWAGLLAWLLGVAAMMVAILFARPLGVHGALFVAEAFLVVPGLVLLRAWEVPLARGLGLQRLTARGWLLSLLMGGALWAGSVGLLELQFAVWTPPPGFVENFQRLHAALKPSGPLEATLSIAAIALMPAVCEEILFRGILLPSFLRTLGTWGAIVASALLFGLIHADPSSFYRVPFALAVALGLGFVRVRSGSLLPGLVAHAVLNTTTFLVVLFGGAPETPEKANVLLGAGLLLGGLAATVMLLRWFPRRPDADT